MNKRKSRLEDLPNELLTDIFKNLNGRDLFRAIHNLNYRFNQLIQSFEHLQLVFHMNPSNVLKTNDEIFSFCIHTLIVDPWINFNLKHFPNVRHLRLNNPLPKLLEQLTPDVMPFLESLSILYTYNMYEMDLLHKKIFSNRFVHLKSCELFEKQTVLTIPAFSQSPSIRILKTEFIDLFVYKAILSACPNLYFFKFWLHPSHRISTNILSHKNLKRMILELQHSNWYYDDNAISEFLACVPNLEVLEVHRRNYSQNIIEYFEHYDWLQSIVVCHLPILRSFKFYLSNDEKLIGTIDKNILNQIHSDFMRVHKGPYKAQFKIDRKHL